jgi:hypothetical protein
MWKFTGSLKFEGRSFKRKRRGNWKFRKKNCIIFWKKERNCPDSGAWNPSTVFVEAATRIILVIIIKLNSKFV